MDSFKHDVSVLGGGQKNFQQCWYASYKMFLKYYSRNENEIEGKLSGAGINVEEAKQQGLLDTDFRKAGEALGFTCWSGSLFNEKQGFWDVGLSDGAEAFLEELKKGPLWVSRYIQTGTYHIVLATGYNDDGKGYIIFNNPFPGPSNALEDGTLPANVFVRHITNAKGSVQAKR